MRVLRRLLRALLPGGVGDAALADLDRERAARTGPAFLTGLWYAREGLRVALRLRAARLTDALTPRRTPRGAHRPRRERSDPMDRLRQNLRFALRRLRRSPGFALAAVLTLALGVGANVAVFSVVDAVLLKPLPYAHPDRLVALWEWNQPRGKRENVANPGNVRAWKERASTLEDVAATAFFDQPMLLDVDGRPREVLVRLATANYFDVLGLPAALGRTFSPGAGEKEGDEVILTDRYWREAYGADPSVIGRTLAFSSGLTGTVVGVLPPSYVIWGESSDMYASFALLGDQASTGRYLNTIARLRDGATVEQAREEMEAVAAGLREEHPEFNAGWSVNVVPLRTQAFGDVDTILWVLFAAVGLLLLIACANVANLFLARATARRREMAVRSSLGASRGRLVGQLLVEGGVLAGLGAAVGVAVAWIATRAVATHLPAAFHLPRVEEAAVNGRALAFAVVVTTVTALLFGLVPALRASEAEPGEALAAEARGPGRHAGRVRSALVVAEVGLSVLLLVGAGLLGRSLAALTSQDLGIRPDDVLTARLSLGTPLYQKNAARVAFLEAYSDRVAALPGVQAAGMVPFLPLDGLGSATAYWAGDAPTPPPGERPVTDVRAVAGDYFGAMGIHLLEGRTFDRRDGADAPRVVVVSRALAREVWPGKDPLGRPLVLSWGDPNPVATVVGVVDDVRLADVATEPRAAAYFPVAQLPDFGAYYVVVRSTRRPADLRADLEAALHDVDPTLALSDVRVMDSIVGRATARPRMSAVLMAAFAALAAALAAVGLYGVLAYAVAQRVREIGLRVALGARPGRVVGRVVGQGMGLVAAGLALGLGVAVFASRALAGLLYQVAPTDPVALAGAAAFLALVALAACVVPAWRAVRVDPAEALRAD